MCRPRSEPVVAGGVLSDPMGVARIPPHSEAHGLSTC